MVTCVVVLNNQIWIVFARNIPFKCVIENRRMGILFFLKNGLFLQTFAKLSKSNYVNLLVRAVIFATN